MGTEDIDLDDMLDELSYTCVKVKLEGEVPGILLLNPMGRGGEPINPRDIAGALVTSVHPRREESGFVEVGIPLSRIPEMEQHYDGRFVASPFLYDD